MKLHSLIKSKGRVSKKARLGRGNASKYGNYSGKGHKGQNARSGGGVSPFFEGGQTPLVMRLPKRKGFKRYFKLLDKYTALNVGTLEKDDNIKSGDKLTKENLVALGHVHADEKIKLLNKGSLTKKLSIIGLEAASAGAHKALEAAGGSIELA